MRFAWICFLVGSSVMAGLALVDVGFRLWHSAVIDGAICLVFVGCGLQIRRWTRR